MSRLADTREVAMYLGVSEGTLRRWRADGGGPPFMKIGKIVRYDMDEVIEWAKSFVPGAEDAYVEGYDDGDGTR